MTKTCVQCGKEFELTDSEVAFFEGKGLELPKRCSACRKENKRSRAKRRYNSKGGKTGSGRDFSDHRGNRTGNVKTSAMEALDAPDKISSNRPAGEKKGFFDKIADAFRAIFSGGK